MDKIKYIYPLFLAVAITKGLVLGFQWTDAPIVAILAAITIVFEIKDFKREYKLLHTRMDLVDQTVTAIAKENGELKNHLGTMKLTQRFNGLNNVNK